MPDKSIRGLLVRADSVCSLVGHRHTAGLSADVVKELRDVSAACRIYADSIGDRDSLAVGLAQAWWPNRYVGDLTEDDWTSVYQALSGPSASASTGNDRCTCAYTKDHSGDPLDRLNRVTSASCPVHGAEMTGGQS